MARGSVTYSGTYGGVSAGANGISLKMSGTSIPAEKLITSISYSVRLSANYASSSQNWRMVEMYIEGTSIEAHSKEVSMGNSNRYTLTGSMDFEREDISAFAGGEFVLHTKANCTGSATSYMWEVSITVNYKDVYETTDPQIPFSVEAGSDLLVSLSNAEINELYHTVTCSIGPYSLSKSLGIGVNETTFSIPIGWCQAITSSTSGTLTITVKTYESDGTAVGTTTTTVTLEVPMDVKPTIESVTVTRIANGVPDDWGSVYIQNVCGITLEMKNCAGVYGSTIESYSFGGSVSVTSKSPTCTLATITENGTIAFTAKVTDTRGRVSDEFVVQIDVIPYNPPSFAGAMAYRCDSAGTSNEQGTYIRAQAAVSFSDCNGKNSITLNSFYQQIGDESWTDGKIGMTPGTFYTFGGGNVAASSTYQVKYVLADTFRTVEKTITVSTSQYLLFFRRGGTALGIGAKSRDDIEYIIDISEDWTVYHGNLNVTDIIKRIAEANIPDIVYSPTQPTAVAGRIWLKPK